MRRLSTTLLVAYAASMTILAAWFGCKALVFQRILSGQGGWGAWDLIPYHELFVKFGGASKVLVGPAYTAAYHVGGIDPLNIAAAAVVILFGCLGLSWFRRVEGPPDSPS